MLGLHPTDRHSRSHRRTAMTLECSAYLRTANGGFHIGG